jgi:hypothetical protein
VRLWDSADCLRKYSETAHHGRCRSCTLFLGEQMTRQITHVGVGVDMFDFGSILLYKRSSFPQTAGAWYFCIG